MMFSQTLLMSIVFLTAPSTAQTVDVQELQEVSYDTQGVL